MDVSPPGMSRASGFPFCWGPLALLQSCGWAPGQVSAATSCRLCWHPTFFAPIWGRLTLSSTHSWNRSFTYSGRRDDSILFTTPQKLTTIAQAVTYTAQKRCVVSTVKQVHGAFWSIEQHWGTHTQPKQSGTIACILYCYPLFFPCFLPPIPLGGSDALAGDHLLPLLF